MKLFSRYPCSTIGVLIILFCHLPWHFPRSWVSDDIPPAITSPLPASPQNIIWANAPCKPHTVFAWHGSPVLTLPFLLPPWLTAILNWILQSPPMLWLARTF